MKPKFDNKPKPTCTCGANSVNSPFHSPWCDSQAKDSEPAPTKSLLDNDLFMTEEEINNLLSEIDKISG